MDKVRMNYYLDMVPVEIRHSIKQLNNDQKWAILIALMKEDKKTFTEIKDDFSANSAEITRALNSLNDGGFIEKRVAKLRDSGSSRKIVYYATDHGKTIMNCFYDSICIYNNLSQVAEQKATLMGYSTVKSPVKDPNEFKTTKIDATTMCNYVEIIAAEAGVKNYA